MKRQFVAAAILALALAPAAFAKNDEMSLIPNDSVSVGVVRLADMRSSPLSAALFAQTAHISNDDDAVVFPSLGETGDLIKPVASSQVGVEEHHLRRRLVRPSIVDIVRLAHDLHPAPERSQHRRYPGAGDLPVADDKHP